MPSTPIVSHTWKALGCSAKKGLPGTSTWVGSGTPFFTQLCLYIPPTINSVMCLCGGPNSASYQPGESPQSQAMAEEAVRCGQAGMFRDSGSQGPGQTQKGKVNTGASGPKQTPWWPSWKNSPAVQGDPEFPRWGSSPEKVS